MISVLIVEDDAYKLEALSEIISSTVEICSTDPCRSVQSAVTAVAAHRYDIIILDMSLPSHDLEKGSMLGIPRLSGGIEVLFELDYIGAKADVVIVTQYPEIEMSGELVPLCEVAAFVKREYGIAITACIYYDSDSTDWKIQIADAINTIVGK